jgi:ubiquinone/menaquinone biosynthesis C-methylase UbiE
MSSDLDVKQKILAIEPSRYWGDDFDVRYYLVSQLRRIQNELVLDVGGGIGIIISEMDKSNLRINLDLAFQDLVMCKQKVDPTIEVICASMTNLPFREKSFSCVICSHILEVAKYIDVERDMVKNIENFSEYPTVERTLKAIHAVLKTNGKLFFTTPNNSYYKSTKLTYNELKHALSNYFDSFMLSFYNTYPRLSKKYRKLNLANVMPKVIRRFTSHEKVLKSLLKNDDGNARHSVSFYVEAAKN